MVDSSIVLESVLDVVSVLVAAEEEVGDKCSEVSSISSMVSDIVGTCGDAICTEPVDLEETVPSH